MDTTSIPTSIRRKKWIYESALKIQEVTWLVENEINLNDTSKRDIQYSLLLLIFSIQTDTHRNFKFKYLIENHLSLPEYYIWDYLNINFNTPFSINLNEQSNKTFSVKTFKLKNKLINNIYSKISKIFDDEDIKELLPHILEVFEYLTDNPNLETNKKKKLGIYYTPNDVVEYIVDKVLANLHIENFCFEQLSELKILDPACGTGIFLKILTERISKQYSTLGLQNSFKYTLTKNIFAIDKSPSATLNSCYILLMSCIDELLVTNESPQEIWNLISKNILCADATLGYLQNSNIKETELNTETCTFPKELLGSYNIQEIFPKVFNRHDQGFNIIIGNPPYYKLTSSNSQKSKIDYFDTNILSKDSNIYMIFLEMMKRYSSAFNYSSGMIVPLSISYTEGTASTKIRELIELDRGSWEFNFFDRSPDSLFGDDVKTRNAIVFRWKENSKSIYTTNLNRWNSRQRDMLFKLIKSIPLKTRISINEWIPKISTEEEIEVLKRIVENKTSPLDGTIKLTYTNLQNESSKELLYFYGTAYNWIPVFKDIPPSFNANNDVYIPNSLWAIKCKNSLQKDFLYILYNSRLMYWLWAITGDGFHFSMKNLEVFKIDNSYLIKDYMQLITSLSEELWNSVKKNYVKKVNSGKSIGNFSPFSSQEIINKIDNLLIRLFKLPKSFERFLRGWYFNQISAGRENFKNAALIKQLEESMVQVTKELIAPVLEDEEVKNTNNTVTDKENKSLSNTIKDKEVKNTSNPINESVIPILNETSLDSSTLVKELIKPVIINTEVKEKSKLTKDEWREWTKTVWSIANISSKDHPAVFPVEIPYRLIRMSSFYGETVIDPFNGTGTTGMAALQCGRKYIGFDTNSNYVKISKNNLEELNFEKPVKDYLIVNESSTGSTMKSIPDNSIGTIVTSPPYWDKANYGEFEGNIGNFEKYDEFLDNVQKVFKECYRVLMPGRRLSIVTANVNQKTTQGLLTFPIAADLIKKAQEIGFYVVNELIWNKDGTGGKWGSSGKQRPIFGSYPHPPNFLFKNVHEYIIILRKPSDKKTSNAPDYENLFLDKPHTMKN